MCQIELASSGCAPKTRKRQASKARLFCIVDCLWQAIDRGLTRLNYMKRALIGLDFYQTERIRVICQVVSPSLSGGILDKAGCWNGGSAMICNVDS